MPPSPAPAPVHASVPPTSSAATTVPSLAAPIGTIQAAADAAAISEALSRTPLGLGLQVPNSTPTSSSSSAVGWKKGVVNADALFAQLAAPPPQTQAPPTSPAPAVAEYSEASLEKEETDEDSSFGDW